MKMVPQWILVTDHNLRAFLQIVRDIFDFTRLFEISQISKNCLLKTYEEDYIKKDYIYSEPGDLAQVIIFCLVLRFSRTASKQTNRRRAKYLKLIHSFAFDWPVLKRSSKNEELSKILKYLIKTWLQKNAVFQS